MSTQSFVTELVLGIEVIAPLVVSEYLDAKES